MKCDLIHARQILTSKNQGISLSQNGDPPHDHMIREVFHLNRLHQTLLFVGGCSSPQASPQFPAWHLPEGVLHRAPLAVGGASDGDQLFASRFTDALEGHGWSFIVCAHKYTNVYIYNDVLCICIHMHIYIYMCILYSVLCIMHTCCCVSETARRVPFPKNDQRHFSGIPFIPTQKVQLYGLLSAAHNTLDT